ncbi:hypothetical protein OPQ81_005295 [Rhizoctonia solani]|nr:hypothetical protein OPQ81_005295 [Rhizoctonia solani]
MSFNTNDGNEITRLVPPQLPHFLANVFNLKPIVGTPNREEVKLVHEAVRALNNLLHTPELRDTDVSAELSQHLFDIQMACHRQKYSINILPNEVIYDPPSLPSYIPVELNPVTGPPSNQEVASVHTALRISESFANVPSIFDSDLHAQLSQHLFDIQLARHVQRSILKRSTSVISAPPNPMTPHRDRDGTDASNRLGTRSPLDATPQEIIDHAGAQHATPEQSNRPSEATGHQNPNESRELCGVKELIVEMRDTLNNVNRVLIGTQNSLASGFNSSRSHSNYNGSMCYDLGAHSLINDRGEVPEACNLPTFKSAGNCFSISFSIQNLSENELARYLRFYSIGEEMIEEGEELKIRSGMMDEAKRLLSARLFLDRR